MMSEVLLNIEMNLGMDKLKSKLINQYRLGNLISVIAVELSLERRNRFKINRRTKYHCW